MSNEQNQPAKTPFELLWSGKPPTCNSCPLYVHRPIGGTLGDPVITGMCRRTMPVVNVNSEFDWCGHHPHHASAIAVAVARLVERRIGANAPTILQPDARSQFEKWGA